VNTVGNQHSQQEQHCEHSQSSSPSTTIAQGTPLFPIYFHLLLLVFEPHINDYCSMYSLASGFFLSKLVERVTMLLYVTVRSHHEHLSIGSEF
jgi:hypothetical protein